jgi:AraC-like DNA-binding protein
MYLCGMKINVQDTVIIFSICLSLFFAVTGWMIVFMACMNSPSRVTRRLNRRLLFFLLALVVTWTGILLSFYFPGAATVYRPFCFFGGLCVPVCLYGYIRSLTPRNTDRLEALHYLLPALSGIAVAAGLAYLPETMVTVLEKRWLLPVYCVFSTVYFGGLLFLLWRHYREERARRGVPLVPVVWISLLVALMFIRLVNVLFVFRQASMTGWSIGVAAALDSMQTGILVYHTIGQNFVLFHEKKTQERAGGREEKPAEKPDGKKRKSSVSAALSRKNFEAQFLKNKLYLDPKLTLPGLAGRLKTSRTYLSSFINREYGMNFNRYVNVCRMKEVERLKLLPKNESLPPGKLAVQAGFGSYRNYLRAKKEGRI